MSRRHHRGHDSASPRAARFPPTRGEGKRPERGVLMPRERLDQVDAMRPMKQAGVISTHVLTYFVPVAAIVSASAVMLLTHFSREGFFFISACMLTYAYRD